MKDINTVFIIGRLTREITDNDYGYAGGTQRLNISVACNESVKNGTSWAERANYFDVTVFGKTAETLHSYLHKGKQVAIIGKLQQQRWEKDGRTYSKIVIIAQSVQLLGGQSNFYQQETADGDNDNIPF